MRVSEVGLPSVVLMTWNVRYFGQGLRGLHTTRGGLLRAARAIASLAQIPDIIALQEVETNSLRAGLRGQPQLDRFVDALHQALAYRGIQTTFRPMYFAADRYGLPRAPAFYTTGLAVLLGPNVACLTSNHEMPDEVTFHRLRMARRIKQRRIVGHVRLKHVDSDMPIDLFNTHLSLPAFAEVGLHRVHKRMGDGSNQTQEIEALLSVIARRAKYGSVVVGDFNARPGSPAYLRMTKAGFVDAFAHANHFDAAALQGVSTAGFGRARMHIDHVFSAASLVWEKLDAYSVDAGLFAGCSDHAPKIGRVQILQTM